MNMIESQQHIRKHWTKKLSMQKKSHTSRFIFWTILQLVSLWSTDVPLLLVSVPSLLSKALVGVFHPDVCRLQFLLCVVCGFLRVCLHLLLDVNKLAWIFFKEKNPFDVWKVYGTLLQFSCNICVVLFGKGFPASCCPAFATILVKFCV